MNITIINQYCENRGDEAAGEALVKNLLALPEVYKIDIIYNSAYCLDFRDQKVFHRNEDLALKKIGKRAIFDYLAFHKFDNRPMKEMARTIRNSDYVFVTPCGASLGIYKDWAFLVRLLFVVKEKKTPIFCLNTINSSHDKIFDHFAKYVLKRSKVYVRETASQKYLSSIGIHSELGVDTAFSLPPVKPMPKKKKTVGMVTTLLGWHPEFQGRDMQKEILENIVPGVAVFCKQKNYDIDLIPHIGSDEEMMFINHVASYLKLNGMDEEAVHIRKDVKTAEQYDEALASEYLVIGMRYHAVVLAAKNAVPFMAIAYENKMKEVSTYTHCEPFCLDLQKPIHKEDVLNTLLLLDKEHDGVKELLKQEYSSLNERARLPLQEIKPIDMSHIIYK